MERIAAYDRAESIIGDVDFDSDHALEADAHIEARQEKADEPGPV